MTLKLTADVRENLGKKAAYVREAGKIPAVIYGKKTDNQNLQLNYVEFEKVLEKAGESTILDITVGSQPVIKALISDVQYEPVSGRIRHVDLRQINMNEKITAKVEIRFTGEAPVVKADGGIVMHNINDLEIRCMPSELIHEIVVDVSSLASFDDVITVADLKLPSNIEIMNHELEDVVAVATAPKVEVEAPVVEVAEGDAPATAEGATPEAAEGDKKPAEKK